MVPTKLPAPADMHTKLRCDCEMGTSTGLSNEGESDSRKLCKAWPHTGRLMHQVAALAIASCKTFPGNSGARNGSPGTRTPIDRRCRLKASFGRPFVNMSAKFMSLLTW